jgi:hypothetical protein
MPTPGASSDQAWAGRYAVTSMLTGVVSTFGACQTAFFIILSLIASGVVVTRSKRWPWRGPGAT